jgi:hypothetical protein
MEATGAEVSATATTSINYTDVTKKFQELTSIFYTTRGCMILTLDDTFSKHFIATHPTLQWNEKYNSHAEAVVLTAKINIIIFGQPYEVYLHRPIKQIHRWEYEYFFGFGGHNAGFSHDRIILTFSETFDKDIDVEYLLMTGTLHQGGDGGDCDEDSEGGEAVCCIIDEKYVKNALKLLVIGGYVKQWSAFNYFKKWFKDRGFNVEIEENNSNKFASFIFEDYTIIES